MKMLEHNVTTGEVIERDATVEELAAVEAQQVARAEVEAERQAKATKRQAVLDRLGITAEEAQLILGGSN
jgi:hypothetical protein